MSRSGRLPIAVPSGVDVKLDGQQVDVKGNTAVNLSGTQAKLEGQSMVEVKSGAMVQVSGSLIKLG